MIKIFTHKKGKVKIKMQKLIEQIVNYKPIFKEEDDNLFNLKIEDLKIGKKYSYMLNDSKEIAFILISKNKLTDDYKKEWDIKSNKNWELEVQNINKRKNDLDFLIPDDKTKFKAF